MRSLIAFLAIVALPFASVGQKNYYTEKWSEVYRFEVRALPKSALAIVDDIYKRAKKEKNITQFTRALIYQSKFAMTLSEDAELVITRKFRAEIAVSKPPQKNILESVLAGMYWEYFRLHRSAYYARDAANARGDDFRLWDYSAMFMEIHRHYQSSLSSADLLKSIHLATIHELLVPGRNSKVYRPTLYDFLAHEALAFYQTGERFHPKSSTDFTIKDPRYLHAPDTVTETDDSLSSEVQALRIFQALHTFHKDDKDRAPAISNELERLEFILERGQFKNENELHIAALQKLKMANSKDPASALIDARLASILYKEGVAYNPKTNPVGQFRKKEALEICEMAIRDFPESDGADQCKDLKEKILEQALQLSVEKYVPLQTPTRIKVSYANVDSVHFFVFRNVQNLEDINDSVRLAILRGLQPEMSWSSALPNLHDYLSHSTEVILPPLANGQHLIVASLRKSMQDHTALYGYAFTQSTNVALVESNLDDKHRYHVLSRITGAPLAGAQVRFFSETGATVLQGTADKDGYFDVRKSHEWTANLVAGIQYNGDQATFGKYFVERLFTPTAVKKEYYGRIFLFSDRSIYRPGQTVYFKGILVKIEEEHFTVVPGEYVEVTLEDINYEEVGHLRLKTNSYGSFSGEFKLPATGLTGEYTITADEDYEGDSKFYENIGYLYESELEISVEEYKRPTFEVTFEPVKDAYRLNDSVRIKGKAMSFSGAAVGGAPANYHVKRLTQYPVWRAWRQRNRYGSEEELLEGKTETDGDGNFIITFPAIPDEEVPKEDFPVFVFEVTADVIDLTGETRSAVTTVRVGYTRLEAKINAPAQINRSVPEHSLPVVVQNLNEQPVMAEGTLHVYKQQAPAHPQRPRPWSAPDLPIMDQEQFARLFPNDPYSDEEVDLQLTRGKRVAEIPFQTNVGKDIKLKPGKSWELGSYLIELTALDASGDSVRAWHTFNLIEPGNPVVPDNKSILVETDKPVYAVGDVAKVRIGSAAKGLTAFIQVVQDGEVLETYTKQLDGQFQEILIPITKAARDGGIRVDYYAVFANAYFSGNIPLQVIQEKNKLGIETITFKDKLLPGAKETWSFIINGAEAPEMAAEVLASMYDASLDNFKPHAWELDLPNRHFNNRFRYSLRSFDESFGINSFSVRNQKLRYYRMTPLFFDSFDDYGFSITGNEAIERNYLGRIYFLSIDSLKSKVTLRNNQTLQQGYIIGKVISAEDGSPLPGVNVVVTGTTRGTVTDAKGEYMLRATKGEQLTFSFIGFATAEITLGRQNVVDASMTADIQQLTEVVVTAQGLTVEKRALGYAVSRVASMGSDEEEGIARLLAGRIPGVTITNVGAGSSPQVVIRGYTTIQGASNPLFVIDGQPMISAVETANIDPADIESVQVLKGEAATVLYGDQGKNGVVIINTKSGQKKIDEELSKVNARKNFNETAFFYPHLTTDEEGRIKFTFTTPESLTRWKLQLMAHNRELQTTSKTLYAVTQKDFMVTPNPPRFLRMGDEMVFSAKIVNLTAHELSGNVTLQLTDAITSASADQAFKNTNRNIAFKIAGHGVSTVSWTLTTPSGIDAVQYRVVAKSGEFSDGEQNVLPVLSNRLLVTETIPMFVPAHESKTFNLNKLANQTSTTLQTHQLSLEVTSNPAWLALQSLPYLMEFPHECSEQTFSRYYANSIAEAVTSSAPKIKDVFDQWAKSDALLSQLETNAELKSTVLQETPWVRDAQNEEEQKKRMALLFDIHSLAAQQSAALHKLEQLQLSDGGFPWFAGSHYASRYITQHIASGFGHLRKLKMVDEKDPFTPHATKAVRYLDTQLLNDYQKLTTHADKLRATAKSKKEGDQLAQEYLDAKQVSNHQIHYLYMRSFYPELTMSAEVAAAVAYYRHQSAQYWQTFNLYLKGMIAIMEHRHKNAELPVQIMETLRETSIVDPEMGMYWKENKAGWYWHESPIETQALLIEAFNEIGSETRNYTKAERLRAIDQLRVWLLRNKRVNQWSSTRAAAEAIYALLLNGTDWLSVRDKLDVTVGGKKVSPSSKSAAEAGTGYYKTSWKGNEVTPAMSKVTLDKKGDGPAWAGLYWQYFEDLDKITSAESPLKLSKRIFLVSRTNQGEFLHEIDSTTSIPVGGILRIRIELKVNQDMEFLHLKDMRASGLEPLDVLSGYKWHGGLGYYQSTKDASTNFFFDSIAKGAYVFDYDLRANNAGTFSNGIATIQSMYAPEFSSHSEGKRIRIK